MSEPFLGERCKIAFLGTHGVGKTTLCYGLAARLKARDLSVEVVHEVARRSPLPINAATTREAQRWIFLQQICEEIVAASRYAIVLCDRSVLDNYVYLLLAWGPDPLLEPLVANWLATYDLLVWVPTANRLKADGVRAVDPVFQQRVEERLRAEIECRRVEVLRLAEESRAAWLEQVESRALELLSPKQLPLELEPPGSPPE